MKRLFLPAFLVLLCTASSAFAQKPGGGNLNPGLFTHEASIEAFMDMRIGLSVHWGPSSLGGKEISWSRDKQIPTETYDSFYQDFNPTAFDADAWMQLMHEGGMKYIMLTSKHHDGFSLWHSAHTDYDIENTPFRRDILRELADAAERHDIVLGSYYSIIDWYHPDYQPYNYGGPGPLYPRFDDTPNFERYLIFMKRQLRELVQDYGAQIIQLDGEWDPTWNHILGSDLYLYLRMLDDRVLVNNRTDVGRQHPNPKTSLWDWRIYAGDFDERERMVDWVPTEHHDGEVYGTSDNPWQAWVTIDQAQWSWNETPRLLTADEIILDLAKTLGDNGNYLINLAPQPSGAFAPEQVAIIQHVGRWVKRHADAIYSTRGGPFRAEGRYTSTQKGDTIFVFALDPTRTTLRLPADEMTIREVEMYDGSDVNARTEGTTLVIDLPTSAEGVSVLRLTHTP